MGYQRPLHKGHREKNHFKSMSYESTNDYYDLYKEAKLTLEEMRTHPETKDMTDEQLETLADELFNLAITAQKIIFEP